MTPNPNPPTIPQYTADNANTMNGNTANATPFEGDNPDRSKSNSPEGRPSPPRIYSPEADGMEVDVEDDDKQNIAQQRRGSKRAWSDDETTADQEEPLSSSDELRLAADQVGSHILDLPKGATEVPAEAAKIYSDLMFRQLHMLKQFIEAE